MLDGLNEAQRQAVLYEDGPLLIVAGPGTGKTHTLTRKIAYTLSQGADPATMAAITFTTKAAEEMKFRLAALVGGATLPFTGTFHAFGRRLLKLHGAGRFRDGRILAEDERAELLEEAAAATPGQWKPKDPDRAAGLISLAKNQMLPLETMPLPESVERSSFLSLAQAYGELLERGGLLDFDDLVSGALQLLEQNPHVTADHGPWRYFFIDEYQDINEAQYRLVRALVSPQTAVCAIGDPDQAIYAFRGSDLTHFLRFPEDFPNTRTIHLETNYRSRENLLEAASALIRHNRHRLNKKLQGLGRKGPKIAVFAASTPWLEGEFITREIETLMGGTDRLHIDTAISTDVYEDGRDLDFGDFAVLYRTKAHGRLIERAFKKHGLPYQMTGGLPWYRTEEVKVVLGFLQVLLRPEDDSCFKAVVNIPKPRIGDATLAKLEGYARDLGIPLITAISQMQAGQTDSSEKERGLGSFVETLTALSKNVEAMNPASCLEAMLQRFELEAHFCDGSARGDARRGNLLQLAATAARYDARIGRAGLSAFVEFLVLLREHESYDPNLNAVALMTLHAAKGLEFPVVFIAGVEESLLPYTSGRDQTDVEEERRLCYVGMTRARNRLYLTWPRKRDGRDGKASPFLAEIPASLIEERKPKGPKGGGVQLSLF